MKIKQEHRREVINKARTNLLLSVDEEIRKRKKSNFKINSMSQEDFLKKIENFYMVEQNTYQSSPIFKEYSFTTDKKYEKSNPLTPHKNSFDYKISEDSSRKNSRPDSCISFVESTNNDLIKSDMLRNKESIIKMYNQTIYSFKSAEISPVLKKKDFVLELKKNFKENNNNESHKAFLKLKQIAKSIKVIRNSKNFNSLNNTAITTIFTRKSKPEVSFINETSIFYLKNDESARKSFNSFKTLDVKPSYELINNQLNEEFLCNFQNDLRKKPNDSFNYSTNFSSNNDLNNIGIVVSEENSNQSSAVSTRKPSETNNKKLSLNYKPKLDVIKKEFVISLKKC
jgi:hypothetical protein